MVDQSLINKIKGLKDLFKIVPEDYNFHDDEIIKNILLKKSLHFWNVHILLVYLP